MFFEKFYLPTDVFVEWALHTYRWMLVNFGGWREFNKCRLILPTQEFYPNSDKRGHELASFYFGLTRNHAGMGRWSCRLMAQEDLSARSPYESVTRSALGTFSSSWTGEDVVITYAQRQLANPPSLIATFAHELSHYYFRSAPNDPPRGAFAEEPATDLGAIYLGFGVFLANAAFTYINRCGYTSKQGYLDEKQLSYALAIFCILKEIPLKDVRKHLKTNPKAYIKAAHKDLLKRWGGEITRSGDELCELRYPVAAVHSVAFSPDGLSIATGGADESVRIWDARTGQERSAFKGHTGFIQTLAFSPDGRRLVSGGDDHTVRVWDVVTGLQLDLLSVHASSVHTILLLDGSRMVTASADGKVRVWHRRRPEWSWGYVVMMEFWLTVVFAAVAFWSLVLDWAHIGTQPQPDETGADAAKKARLAQLRRRRSTRILMRSTGLAVLLAGSAFALYRDWQPWGEPLILAREGHAVTTAFLSTDGRRVVTAGTSKMARVWDATSGEVLFDLEGHESGLRTVSFSPGGEFIVTAEKAGNTRVWDAESGRPIGFPAADSVEFSSDARRIVGIGKDGAVNVWDARTRTELRVIKKAPTLACVSVSPDGEWFVGASWDSTARVWDAESGRELRVLKGHESPLSAACISPDGARIVTAGEDGSVRLWDAASGDELRVVTHGSEVTLAICSPDGRRIASASLDGIVLVWQADTGAALRGLRGDGKPVRSVSFSPDGRRLVTTGSDHIVRVWDIDTGEELEGLRGRSVAFSEDGRRIATVGRDGIVRVRDADRLEELATLRNRPTDGPMPQVAVAISDDGRRIVTTGIDLVARRWDLRHPEQWWGAFRLWPCWTTMLLGLALTWSLWSGSSWARRRAARKRKLQRGERSTLGEDDTSAARPAGRLTTYTRTAANWAPVFCAAALLLGLTIVAMLRSQPDVSPSGTVLKVRDLPERFSELEPNGMYAPIPFHIENVRLDVALRHFGSLVKVRLVLDEGVERRGELKSVSLNASGELARTVLNRIAEQCGLYAYWVADGYIVTDKPPPEPGSFPPLDPIQSELLAQAMKDITVGKTQGWPDAVRQIVELGPSALSDLYRVTKEPDLKPESRDCLKAACLLLEEQKRPGAILPPEYRGGLRPVSFQFINTPLDEALSFLQSLGGPKVVWYKPPETKRLPLNLKVKKMHLRLAIAWCLRQSGTRLILKDDAYWVVDDLPAQRPNPRSEK